MILKKVTLYPSIKSLFAIFFVVVQVVSAGPAGWTIYKVSTNSHPTFIEPRSTEENTPEALIALVEAPRLAESKTAVEYLILKNDYFILSEQEPAVAAKKSGKGKSSAARSDVLGDYISSRLGSLYEDYTSAHFKRLLPDFIVNFCKCLYGINPEPSIIPCDSPLFEQVKAFKVSILVQEKVKIFMYLDFDPSTDLTLEKRLKFSTQFSSLFPTSCVSMLQQTETNMMSIIELINNGKPTAASIEKATSEAVAAPVVSSGKSKNSKKKKSATAKAAASVESSTPSAAEVVDSATIAAALIAEQEAEARKEEEARELARQKEEDRKQRLRETQEAAARAKAEEDRKRQEAEIESRRLQSIKDREAAESRRQIENARRAELRAAELQAKKEAREAELERKRRDDELLAQQQEQERQRQRDLIQAREDKKLKEKQAKELKARERNAERARKLQAQQEQQAQELLLREEQQRAEAVKKAEQDERTLKEQQELARQEVVRQQQEEQERQMAARLQKEEEERQMVVRLQKEEQERQMAAIIQREEQEQEEMRAQLDAVRLERARLAEALQMEKAALARERERSRSTASIPKYTGFEHDSPTSSVTSQEYSPFASPEGQNSFYRPPPPGFAGVAPVYRNQQPQQYQQYQQYSPMGTMHEQQQYQHFPSPQSQGSNGSSRVAYGSGYAQNVVPPQAVASSPNSAPRYYSPFGNDHHDQTSPYSGGVLGGGLQVDTSSDYSRPRGASIFDQNVASSGSVGSANSSGVRSAFPGLFASPQSTSNVVGGPVSSRRIVEPVPAPAVVTHSNPFSFGVPLNGLDLNQTLSDSPPPLIDNTHLYQQQQQQGPPPSSETDRSHFWY